VLTRIREVVHGTAAALGVEVKLELDPGYPVVMNAPQCADAVRRVASSVVGADRVSEAGLPIAGGEDFAYMAQAVPGAFFFVGAGRPEGDTPGCHHPDFDFDDALIPTGVAMFVGLVDDRLGG
jgi:metal-dependent amidase/aminoacylase/carboxypeptidase family protein